MRELLHNSIQCPDGTILTSHFTHNFVEHTQEDGREYFVDGGLDYNRVGYSDKEYIDLCIYSDDERLKIREHFEWGTYGKEGDQSLKYVKLKDIDDDHLVALLEYTKESFPSKIVKVFKDEYKFRGECL